ncbi:MAG: cell envelope protein TolA [Nevskia sp.]|nr:cell envelope protein TolA [Nevskia sp.]
MAEAITHKWKRTPDTDKNARALVKVEINTDGDVIAAEITESDGDAAFNESVIQAIYRTSPLPLPEDSRFFDSNLDICMSQNRRSCR